MGKRTIIIMKNKLGRYIWTLVCIVNIMLVASLVILEQFNSHLVILLSELRNKNIITSDNSTMFFPQLSPWSSIGGCGAGGSGGAGCANAKWIGRGVSGGLLDLQGMCGFCMGQNFQTWSFSPRFSFKPTWTSTMGITIPVLSKVGGFQKQAQFDARTEVTGGLGDIALDYSKNMGMEGQYSLNFSFVLPTGQYDIKRGPEGLLNYLPASLQKGSGNYSAALGIGYSKSVEDGFWLFDLTYTHPFAMRLNGKSEINGKPGTFNYDPSAMNSKDRKRFEYYFKPYGENDLGAYAPPSISGSVYFGDRKDLKYVYSYGVTFSVPLGVAWIHSFEANKYDPFPDPDFKTWTASLNYGMEFGDEKYPLFLAISLPIQDKANPPSEGKSYNPDDVYKIDGPDWNNLFQMWAISLGIKSTMF